MNTKDTTVVEEVIIKFVIDVVWEATDGGVKMTPQQFSHFEEPLGAMIKFQDYFNSEISLAVAKREKDIVDILSDEWCKNGKNPEIRKYIDYILSIITNN